MLGEGLLERGVVALRLRAAVRDLSDNRLLVSQRHRRFTRCAIYQMRLCRYKMEFLIQSILAPACCWWWMIALLGFFVTIQRRGKEADTMLEIAERQNLALTDARRLADVLRSMASRQHKTMCVEGARAVLRRGSRSVGDFGESCSKKDPEQP